DEQVAGRLLTRVSVCPHTIHVVILRAIHPLPGLLDDKIVACDTVYGGNASSVHRAVADRRVRGDVGNIRILTGEALIQQTLEPTLTIAFVKTIQVVPTHLVNHKPDNELWSLNGFLCTSMAYQ